MTAAQVQRLTVSEPLSGQRSRCSVDAAKDMAVLTIDADGLVCDCDRACEALFDYSRSELVRHHVSMLLPQLADFTLLENGEPNARLRFLSHVGCGFQAIARGGKIFDSEIFLNHLDNAVRERLSLIVRFKER